MKTILLTGARAPVTLDLARSFHAAGYRVIGAESMEYPLSRHSRAYSGFYRIEAPNHSLSRFEQGLLEIIRKEKVDILIPTCEEAFHVSKIKHELIGKTHHHITILVDEFDTLARLHSKVEFNHWVKKIGLSAPMTLRAATIQELQESIQTIQGTHVVLKPEYSRFAAQALILEKSEALKQVHQIHDGRAWAVQEFLSGKEFCTYSLARNGKLISHVSYAHEFTAGKGAGICFESIHHDGIERWIERFVSATNFTGQIAFDFIESSDGKVQPLECNPRATSGLHLIANHPRFLSSLVHDSTQFELIRPRPGNQGQLRLAMLIYGLPSIRRFRDFANWIGIFVNAREVVFSWNDLRPFFDQFVSFFILFKEAKRLNVTPLEVSTRDIEWNGP